MSLDNLSFGFQGSVWLSLSSKRRSFVFQMLRLAIERSMRHRLSFERVRLSFERCRVSLESLTLSFQRFTLRFEMLLAELTCHYLTIKIGLGFKYISTLTAPCGGQLDVTFPSSALFKRFICTKVALLRRNKSLNVECLPIIQDG